MARVGRSDIRFRENPHPLQRQPAALIAAYQLSGLFTQPGPIADIGSAKELLSVRSMKRPGRVMGSMAYMRFQSTEPDGRWLDGIHA